jgi:nucleoid-associated protein YgaU
VIRAAAAGAFAALCVLAIAGVGLSALSARFASQDKRPQAQILAQISPVQFNTQPDQTMKPPTKPISLAPLNVHDGSAGSANELIVPGAGDGTSTTVQPVPEQPDPEASPAANVVPVKLSSPVNPSAPAQASASTTILVKAGDTLSKIATRIYGSFGTDGLGRLTAANPEIKDRNLIYPGQAIRVSQTGK